MHDTSTKQRLVRTLGANPGERVLDIGCGTGTLTVLLKKQFPSVEVFGADIDSAALGIAEEKARKEGVDIIFQQCGADSLPFATSSFDHGVSSLLLHHLSLGTKRATLREIARVLRPGAKFHLLDWGMGATRSQRAVFTLVRLLDGFETTHENARGQLPTLIAEAGFTQVTEAFRETTVFGTLQCFESVRRQQVLP